MRAELRALALAVIVRGWALRAEILTATAFLAGWLLVTSAIVALTSPVAWRVSLGLLALSLGGWKLFASLILDGFYVLTLDERKARRG